MINNNKSINFSLLNYINSNNNYQQIKSYLLENKIRVREYENSDLVVLSNKFKENLNEIQTECRSIIFDRKNMEIICYAFDNIKYNQQAKMEFLKQNPEDFIIQESFEGTLLSVFYYDNKWYISTRQCLNACESKWKTNKSHYDMFLECINVSFDEFTNFLKKEYNYFFVLLHYDNKHIVDYTSYFNNPNYKTIVHIMTKDKKTHQDIDIYSENQWNGDPKFVIPCKLSCDDNKYKNLKKFIDSEESINIPHNYNDFQNLDINNMNDSFDLPITSEGLIVKIIDSNNNKTNLLKFQTNSYQIMSLLNPNTKNIYMGFVELYKKDLLKQHLDYFPGNVKINNIYDTIGIIDASFKVLTSELFEIFRYLYDLKNCSHKNSDFYKILPSEYTVVLYKIRGIYYKKKEKYIKNKIDSIVMDNTYNYSLKIFDIYNLLKKSYEIREIMNLFKARQIFISTYSKTKYSTILKNISSKCEVNSLKMILIFTNKLFENEEY